MALRTSIRKLGQKLRGASGTVIVAGAAFLLVAGIGAAASYFKGSSDRTSSGSAISSPLPSPGSDGETLARLKDYTQSIGTGEQASKPDAGKLLPDVNTMIERLAARLKTAPDDVKGWRMLGWSYYHTGRYEQAASAFAKAVELDPNSAELKSLHEEAKAKAADGSAVKTGAGAPSVGDGKNDQLGAGKAAKAEAKPSPEYDTAIRAMVDGLANRLENSPRDVEGWTRLMRSRIVLGEREVAATALRKALEVFKDDEAASRKITAAASELGLKAE